MDNLVLNMRFVNREQELKVLNDLYQASRRGLVAVVVTGLRRVGKTRLIIEFTRGKPSLYFFVNPEKRREELLREFSEVAKEKLGLPPYVRVESWRDFFLVLREHARGWVVVFDEFQNFTHVAPEVFGELQRFIDESEDVPLMLIFSGSIIGTLQEIFEDRARPLYGRVTTTIKVRPFDFERSILLAEQLGYSEADEFVYVYALLGGFPRYYALVERLGLQRADPLKLARGLFLEEFAPLRNEGRVLLSLELGRRRRIYFAILEAVSLGFKRPSEIASYLRVSQTSLSQYLEDLVAYFELLRREVPVTADPRKTKRSHYEIGVHALRFWFRYVHRNWSLLEGGDVDTVLRKFARELDSFVAPVFEEIAREFLLKISRETAEIPELDRVGRWWRGEHEIDVVGLSEAERTAVLIEVKWGKLSKRDAERVLRELRRKAQFLDWRRDRREIYGLIARRVEGKEDLRSEGFLVWDVSDIVQYLRTRSRMMNEQS